MAFYGLNPDRQSRSQTLSSQRQAKQRRESLIWRLSDSYFHCVTVNRFFQIQGISKRSTYSTAPQVSCLAAWQVYLLTSFTLTERKRTKRQRRLSPLVKNLTGRPPTLNLCSISPLLKKHPMKSMNLVGRL